METRTILVTGGNRGIGLAIIEALANNSSDKILLGCRNLESGKDIASKISPMVEAIQLDLSDSEILAKNISKIKETYPAIDVLINNAGVIAQGGVLDVSRPDIDHCLQVNTMGPLQLTQAFLPDMIKRGYGRIVNVSSGWGSFDDGLEGPFAYSLSKAAMNALTLASSRDLPNNIKINCTCPGWVRTRMSDYKANRSPEEGGRTAVWLANLPEDGPNGKFFRTKKEIPW